MKKYIYLLIGIANLSCANLTPVRLPAQPQKLKGYYMSIECPYPDGVQMTECDMVLDKKGVNCDNVRLSKCQKEGKVFWGFDIEGISDLDSHIQYLYKR